MKLFDEHPTNGSRSMKTIPFLLLVILTAVVTGWAGSLLG